MPDPNALPPVIPPDTMLGDPARRAKFESEVVKVAELTALLGAVARVVPGIPGKVIAVGLAGLEKNPEGGTVRPGLGTAGNLLPAPIGYVDPTTYGLPKNFYLPPGASKYVPPVVDRIGLGLPEQRREDEANAILDRERADITRRASALAAVENETDETLADLVAGRGGLTRAGVVRAVEGVGDTAALERAAAEELARRGASTRPGALVDPAAVAGALAQRIASGQLAPVIPAPSGGGPVDPTSVPPTTFDGQGAEDNAKPPMRNLATERADP